MKTKFILTAILSLILCNNSFSQVVPNAETIKITGETSSDYAGESVVALGDITGDFYPDFAVNARRYPSGQPTGRIYITKGKPEGIAPNFNLANANIKIIGGYYEAAGNSLQSAGDMDKDAINDLMFTTVTNQVNPYLVYGNKNFPSTFNVADIGNTVRGVKFIMAGGLVFDEYDTADVVGSNKRDIVFSGNQTGEVYVIDGDAIPTNGTLTISPAFFNGINGYKYVVPGATFASTFAIGDFNGDGAKKLAILNTSIGKAMILVKKNTSKSASITLDDSFFSNGGGTKINTYIVLNSRRVAALDVNGDNYDDLILFGGTQYPNRYDNGVYFGKAAFPAFMDSQSDLDGTKGSLIRGLGDMGSSMKAPYTFVRINDINLDGKRDFAVTDYMNKRILQIPVRTTWPALYDVNADSTVKKLTSTRAFGFGSMINYSENLLGGIGCGSDPALLIGTFSGSSVGESYIQKLVQ